MEIRPAATLAVTRDTASGLEVLMLQRTWDAVFMPGYYVFPGGAVDPADHQCQAFLTGGDDASISHDLNLSEGGSLFMIAAIRESFEEAGLMLALDRDGQELTPAHPVFADRDAMVEGSRTLAELCRRHDLTLPMDRLAYLSHWVTPPGPPRRYDTRFFVAAAPAAQTPAEDGIETIDHVWLSPQEALAEHRAGTRLFGSPTLRTLRILSDYRTTTELMQFARSQPPEPLPRKPWPARRNNQTVDIEPGAAAFDEVHKLDPKGRGTARAEIIPGEPVTVAPGVVRLTAPNPGMMTGPGTNTYLLGAAEGPWTVIDPGPADNSHIERILEVTGGRIGQILTTHTHLDHSPATAGLLARVPARVKGMPAPEGASQDRDFTPDEIPRDGDRIETGAGILKVLFTPGHASNHLCFLLEGENMLFAGDHIMQGSTVVINPPDGDMKAYLESLDRLLREDIDWIAPAHGFLIGHVQSIVDFLTTHRLTRERKVVDTLKAHGPASLKELTRHAYDDVPAAIHGVASRSLLAHLLKLEKENRAGESDGQWYSLS